MWTEGARTAMDDLLSEFKDNWFKILIQMYASFICFSKNWVIYLICFIYILIVTFVYIGLAFAYCFISYFGILFYGFIRVCLMVFCGYFVESCDPPCDDQDTEHFQFTGSHKFDVKKSFFYTFVRHILWYYFLIVLFVILPVINSELGNSYIFLGVLFAVIIGNMIYKFLHPKKIAQGTEMDDREMREPSAPPLDDDGTHMAGEMKDAIFSFLKGKKDHSEVDPYRDASAPPLDDDDSGTHVAGDMKDAIFSFLKDNKSV